jgi:hypothetical protein
MRRRIAYAYCSASLSCLTYSFAVNTFLQSCTQNRQYKAMKCLSMPFLTAFVHVVNSMRLLDGVPHGFKCVSAEMDQQEARIDHFKRFI